MGNIGKEFIKFTRYATMKPSDQLAGLPQPPLQTIPSKAKKFINLPDPEIGEEENHKSFKDLADNRQSVRKYLNEPISLEKLSYLLWCSQGVNSVNY